MQCIFTTNSPTEDDGCQARRGGCNRDAHFPPVRSHAKPQRRRFMRNPVSNTAVSGKN